ncbi:hypothetical protein AB0N09_30880 [Streptomyces erythrochromogenes]|uniref:hypothetical protein n=1 Tax=Streptomyces erythrochromogenes TaxID=285574 RepID=UPI003421E84C
MPDSPHTESQPDGSPETGSAAWWRENLRKAEVPAEFSELPRRQRRRAEKHWRKARQEVRAKEMRRERTSAPTPLTIPVIAILLSAAVLGWVLFHPEKERPAPEAKPTPTASAPQGAAITTAPTPTPSAPAPSAAPAEPEAIARGFAEKYSTRYPYDDGTHRAAVNRASAYISPALALNLAQHDDRDFNQLVAAQATAAVPTRVDITAPDEKQRPSPDTTLRRWLQATIAVSVEGTTAYTYTRSLTVEISRAEIGDRWMVTRVVGLEE